MLLLHAGMIVSLNDVLAPRHGLVKDKLGKVLDVVLRERDQKRLSSMPKGYSHVEPEFMAKGVWVQLQKYANSSLSTYAMPVQNSETMTKRPQNSKQTS